MNHQEQRLATVPTLGRLVNHCPSVTRILWRTSFPRSSVYSNYTRSYRNNWKGRPGRRKSLKIGSNNIARLARTDCQLSSHEPYQWEYSCFLECATSSNAVLQRVNLCSRGADCDHVMSMAQENTNTAQRYLFPHGTPAMMRDASRAHISIAICSMVILF